MPFVRGTDKGFFYVGNFFPYFNGSRADKIYNRSIFSDVPVTTCFQSGRLSS